jgi:flavin reductase (DIM6/NTAB) family NADH-FMN oxidoreductase RutF
MRPHPASRTASVLAEPSGTAPGHAGYRDAMSSVAVSVALITTLTDVGTPSGLTVSSLASHSDQPPTVSFNVALTSRSYDAVSNAETLGVHLLAADQGRVAQVFSSRATDKFAAVDWCLEDGVPRILGALVFLRCRTAAVFRHGDHSIVLAAVRHAHCGRGVPLLYSQRSFAWRLTGSDNGEP